MGYYPLFLKLGSVKALLAGAGEVGRRKAVDLLACGPAELLWVDPEVSFEELLNSVEFKEKDWSSFDFESYDYLEPASFPLRPEPPEADSRVPAGPDTDRRTGLAGFPGLIYEQRQVRPEDVDGRELIFAATGSRAVNRMLADICAKRKIFCNVVDSPTEGNFFVPAHFNQGNILLALSTGGISPALSRRLRRELQEWFGDRYAPLLTVMGRIRPLVLGLEAFGGLEKSARAAIFRNLINSELASALTDKDMAKARELLVQFLPPPLQACIGDILYEPF
jgi:precorrin-2 dehydrogenase/sirohydrochlorin ferrochelatase